MCLAYYNAALRQPLHGRRPRARGRPRGVRIELLPCACRVAVSIADTGSGIAPTCVTVGLY